ncbi:MAG: HAD-IIB family hydrolase [Dehalococcoidia bacterium]
MKRLVVFDLDGTLAESKSSLDPEMARVLRALLGVAHVAVISGGDWPQFESQLLASLETGDHLRALSLLPTCGTKFYEYDGAWKQRYADNLSAGEVEEIVAALQGAVDAAGVAPAQTWGEQIENRDSQITFSALGQQAPLAAKKEWDPDFAKRQRIKALLDATLPHFSVRLGGTTSIDVTKPGIDKAYGIRRLVEALGITIPEMIFVGDALFPGGNDYPAREAGVTSIQVDGPKETKRVVETIVACLE